MPKQMSDEFQQLDKQLNKTIKKMKKLQKQLAADAQPASMHELDTLTALGVRYGELVDEMHALLKAEQEATQTA